MLVKGIVFHLESSLPPEVKSLIEDFRLAVNSGIRADLQARVTSRYALTKLAYKGFRQSHQRIYAKHLSDSRMGTEFVCECGWRLDRHINASINLLQTAISKGLEVAGGLRFDPGAFQHDLMMILYDPARGARSEPNETSCVQVVT